MTVHRLCRRIIPLVSVICLFLCGIVSYAEEPTYSLKIKFITESGPATDASFEVYYAMTPDGTLAEDFAERGVDVGSLTDAENVSRLASTLASYVGSGVGEPVVSGSSNALGQADFEELTAGIYLIVGSVTPIGDLLYTPKPALVRVPDSSSDVVTVDVKYDVEQVEKKISRTVKKVWDDGDSKERPQSVEIQLFKDGELFEAVVLSEDNGWTYTWDELSASSDWSVIEKSVPENYTVSVTLDGETFVVLNKGKTEIVSPSPSVSPSVSPSPSPSPDTPTPTTDSGISGESSKPPKLPQTGQLWYPVPILIVLGLVLFMTGFISDRLSDDDEKK